MNISLPDRLKAYVEEQATQRGYSTRSEYMRELIRKGQECQHLRGLLLEGAACAPAGPADASYFEGLRRRVGGHGKWQKAIIPRALANRDVDEAIAWYLGENTPQAALGLADALE